MRSKIMYPLISMLVILVGCKKISTPTEESKAIFGSWRYRSSTGGFSGEGSTTFNSENWIEFTEKGFFRLYKRSKKESQKRFEIELKKSIYETDLRPAIVYRDGSYETYQVVNDTLYIIDEAYDGYTYQYVRK
nr:hypothetical protein [uncultured Fluviicola sp.]